MQLIKEIQNCKMPTNKHLSLMTIGFSLIQNIPDAKTNISFTYLPGSSGPSFIFLLFLGTKTINETGHYYPHILSASMKISLFIHEVLFLHE